MLLRAEDKNFKALLHDNFLVSSTLILVLTNGTLSNPNCAKALELATIKNKKIILVHDTKSDFPQYSEIQKLPEEVQYVFSTIAIPLAEKHLSACWNKISDKIFERIKVFNTCIVLNLFATSFLSQ